MKQNRILVPDLLILANWNQVATLADIGGSGYLPLGGGTLTGPINGTNATFSGEVIGAPLAGGLLGLNINDSAGLGIVGEIIASNVPSGLTLTSGNAINLANISVTPGDWDITGEIWITVGTNGASALHGAINSVGVTLRSYSRYRNF